MPRGPEWSPKESCIAFYFFVRGPFGAGVIAHDVINLRCGTDRSANACGRQIKKLRDSIPGKYGRENPLKAWGYDLDIVDYWLSQQKDKNKKELEAWLGIEDDKIVDEKVLDTVKKYQSPTVDVQKMCSWKLRI